MMFSRRQTLSMLASAAVLARGNLAFAQSLPPVKLGALLPISGFGASYGTLFKLAVQIAVEDVNKDGGINGSPIELLIEDDQFQAAQSVLLFRRLAGEDVCAVVGPISGTGWENIVPIANAMRVPAVNYSALKPGVSKKPYALRVHPADDTLIPDGLAEFRKIYPDVKNVVVIGDSQEASAAAGVKQFGDTAKELGLNVLDTVTYMSKTTDFSPVVIKLRDLNPDAVLISSHVGTCLPLMKEMEAQGFQKPLLASSLVWGGTNFVLAVGSAGKNLNCIGFNTNEPEPGNARQAAFTTRYLAAAEKTNLQRPTNVGNLTVCYDAIMMIADVLRKAGMNGSTDVSTMRQTLIDGLNQVTEWKGINDIKMRDTGDGFIRGHVLKADVDNKRWIFALPADQRKS